MMQDRTARGFAPVPTGVLCSTPDPGKGGCALEYQTTTAVGRVLAPMAVAARYSGTAPQNEGSGEPRLLGGARGEAPGGSPR
jgi:hypothetical protein